MAWLGAISADQSTRDLGTIAAMNMFPWQLLLVTLTGWTKQHQLRIIEYQQEEIRILRELRGKRSLRFPECSAGRLRRHARLGGILNSYCREAA